MTEQKLPTQVGFFIFIVKKIPGSFRMKTARGVGGYKIVRKKNGKIRNNI